MPLTPEAVREVTFEKAPFGRRGYHEDQVDDFLDKVESALLGKAVLTAAQVRDVVFDAGPLIKRGYHEDQVDTFLDDVVEELESRERAAASPPMPGAGRQGAGRAAAAGGRVEPDGSGARPGAQSAASGARPGPSTGGQTKAGQAAGRQRAGAPATAGGQTRASGKTGAQARGDAVGQQSGPHPAPRGDAAQPTRGGDTGPGPLLRSRRTGDTGEFQAVGSDVDAAISGVDSPGRANLAPAVPESDDPSSYTTGQTRGPALNQEPPAARAGYPGPLHLPGSDAPRPPGSAPAAHPSGLHLAGAGSFGDRTTDPASTGGPHHTGPLPLVAPGPRPFTGWSATGGAPTRGAPTPSSAVPGRPTTQGRTGDRTTAGPTGASEGSPWTTAAEPGPRPAAQPPGTSTGFTPFAGWTTAADQADAVHESAQYDTGQRGHAPHNDTADTAELTDLADTAPYDSAPYDGDRYESDQYETDRYDGDRYDTVPTTRRRQAHERDPDVDSDVPYLPLPPAPPGVRGYRPGDVERLAHLLDRVTTEHEGGPTAEQVAGVKLNLTFFVGQGYHPAAVDALHAAWVAELRRRAQ